MIFLLEIVLRSIDIRNMFQLSFLYQDAIGNLSVLHYKVYTRLFFCFFNTTFVEILIEEFKPVSFGKNAQVS